VLGFAVSAHAADRCRSGDSTVADAQAITVVRSVIQRTCPCAAFDGSSRGKSHRAFVRCAQAVIDDATDGSPLLDLFTLRKECRTAVRKIYAGAACGYRPPRVMCCASRRGKLQGRAKPVSKCKSSSGATRYACHASPFAPDACRADAPNVCTATVQTTIDIPSPAKGPHTFGTPGVTGATDKFVMQFGALIDLNKARYTRWRLAGSEQQPDAILILVPGFEGGAGNFKIFAENLIARASTESFVLEVWGFDRRSNQLEDLGGLDVAEAFLSPEVAVDWLFGNQIDRQCIPGAPGPFCVPRPLHPLIADYRRRAVFYGSIDLAFFADWTNLVFSRDIDAVVTAARAAARNQNVFLGGHSAGTGFAARYASTDFDLGGGGPADPGYAKLRGLVLLEGGGGSTAGDPLTDDSLDRIEAKFDGGLVGAVRDVAPRCVDGLTPCTIATEAVDCAGKTPPKCTPPVDAYAGVPNLLNPSILAAGEVAAIQAATDPDGGLNALLSERAIAQVPELAPLAVLPPGTALGGLGTFVDDDGAIASFASFVATSVGAPGPTVGGRLTWQDITEGPLPASVLPDNGPAPTTLPGTKWGQEKEVTRFDRLVTAFYAGGTNFTDWYYPVAGPSTTSVAGVCTSGICSVGDVGTSCTADAQCSQSIGLDSSALSIGRGRRDIENLTQAPNVDVPVIAFGGTNGLATVPGAFVPFATSIGTCTAPSCDGTPRVVDATLPNPAFPTLGGVAGGFEVVMAEGFAHLDVVTAEDSADNPIPAALVAFLRRNVQ
jgi:pimeloyl-ACP methyl ester carboxylesterase